MAPSFDSVLLIGFGGPTKGCCRRYSDCPGEAFCYVQGIVGERSGGDERIHEVAAHYELFGGVSPFSFFSQKQAGALELVLQIAGTDSPVYVGFRYWTPYIRETLEEMVRNGRRKALGVILAPHRTKVSREAYRSEVRKAREEIGPAAPEVEYLDASWHTHPGFVGAITNRVRRVEREMGPERFQKAALIFTAHSIPVPMAKTSSYAEEFTETSAKAAETLGRESYLLAYQSSPSDNWLGPDVTDVIRMAAAEGAKEVVLAPVGFICDHVEVLFDLDHEARETAEACGVGYFRAGTVGMHPGFIHMLRDLVLDRLNGKLD